MTWFSSCSLGAVSFEAGDGSSSIGRACFLWDLAVDSRNVTMSGISAASPPNLLVQKVMIAGFREAKSVTVEVMSASWRRYCVMKVSTGSSGARPNRLFTAARCLEAALVIKEAERKAFSTAAWLSGGPSGMSKKSTNSAKWGDVLLNLFVRPKESPREGCRG